MRYQITAAAITIAALLGLSIVAATADEIPRLATSIWDECAAEPTPAQRRMCLDYHIKVLHSIVNRARVHTPDLFMACRVAEHDRLVAIVECLGELGAPL